MSKFFPILILLLGVRAMLQATPTDTLWLRYIPGKNAVRMPTNQIVGELARENGYLLKKFSLAYVFERSIECDPESGEMLIKLVPRGISGPAAYLDYPLDYILSPSGFRLRVEVKGYGKTLLDEALPWPASQSSEVHLQVHSCADTLLFRLSEPDFSDAQVDALRAAMYHVRTYKAIGLALQSAFELANRYDYRDTTCMGCLAATATELERVHKILSNLTDSLSLPLTVTDPDGILERLRILGGEVYRRNLFLSRLKGSSLEDAVEAATLSAAFIISWIKSDGFLNPLYNHVYRRLASVSAGKEDVFFYRISDVIPEIPDQWRDSYTKKLSEILLRVGKEYQSTGLYDQSFILIANARDILKMAGHDNEADLLESSLQEPLLGLYQVYLDVATDAVKNGNLAMGEDYLQKAISFRTRNRAYLPGRFSEIEVYGRFADACLDKIVQLHDLGRYEEAFPYLLKAYEYARRLTVYLRHPELDHMRSILVQKCYGQMLEKALIAFKAKDYAAAGEQLEKWMNLRQTWSAWLQPSPSEDSVLRMYQVAKIYDELKDLRQELFNNPTDSLYNRASQLLAAVEILKLTDEAEFCSLIKASGRICFDASVREAGSHLWDFHFPEAELSLARADSIAQRWYIADCSEVNQTLEAMHRRMDRQRVIFASYQFDKYHYRALSSFESGYYALGKAYADTALLYACCGIDTHSLESLLGRFASAVLYDKALQRLDYFYALQQADSMEHIRQRLFLRYQSDTTLHGLFPQPDTFWLLKLRPRSWVFDFYFQPLLNQSGPEAVLHWMEKLRFSGMPAEWLESWQQTTAKALAAKDVDIKSTESAYARLAQLAPDVLWYRTFRENYLNRRLSIFQKIRN